MLKEKRTVYLIILILVCGIGYSHGQNKNGNEHARILSVDSDFLSNSIPVEAVPNINLNNRKDKSPVLAAVLSAVLPGAGEIYTGYYLKAALFLVIEAAAVTTAVIYTHKGDFQTAFFQQYANEHWSAARYAHWTINNIKSLNPNVDPSQYHVFNSDGSVDWSGLNSLESAIGGGYSHNLATFGTQDYYEIIGKYPQFSHGWDTSNPNDTDFHILTPQFLWYAHQRGLANSLYTTGNTAIIALYINHFLSLLDAVWSAHSYNSSLALNMRVNNRNIVGQIELTPTLNLSFGF